MAEKRKDLNELAKKTLDQAVNEQEEKREDEEKPESPKPKAGSKGGLKGGLQCAKNQGPKKRREISKKAALARWKENSP